MRIDYSEPKKSCSSLQSSQSHPRKESSGSVLIVVFITAVLSLGIGFGCGWMLSQRSAKMGFKAAMEQQSLENSPQQAIAQPSPQQPATTAPLQAATQQPQASGSVQNAVGAGEAQNTAEAPLSFYKSLPSGQKSNVMGSGINSKEDKPVKQPLQAAMPTNMTRPDPPQNDENAQKQPTQPAAIKSSRQDSSGLTVQVASYSLKSEADALRSKLSGKGYNVNIVESHLRDKGTWYRVRVGKRLDPEAAKELAGKLGKGAVAVPDKD